MSDLIDRQAAIDALDEIRHALWEIDIPSPTVPEYVEHHEQVQSVWKLLDKKQKELYVLPSAQPEPNYDEWCTDCKEYDTERHCCPRWNRVIRETLKDAQPEIVLCKDCKHNPKYEWFGCPMCHLSEKQRPETAWCWKAERRTDEEKNI